MPQTNSQKMAQAAYAAVRQRVAPPGRCEPEKYASFARSFPSLAHACGLAQAVTFAKAKGHGQYLDDLAAVLAAAGHPEISAPDELETQTRYALVHAYVRLSRNALQAAGWLKRYVEAVAPE